MKRLNFLSILMLTVMVLPLVVACSSDDSKGSSKIDDVNVINGKKLVKLGFSSTYSGTQVYKIDYDNKGRLSEISSGSIKYQENESQQMVPYDTVYSQIASIHYDTQVVSIPFGNKSESFSFSLNDKGYISRIGGCTLTYDSQGYLNTVDEGKRFATLYYDSNDFIKASISKLVGGVALYYVPYANSVDEGILYIRVQHSDEGSFRSNIDRQDICVFIAYQAGLLGQVTKTVLNLKDPNEAKAVFEYDGGYSESGEITFVWK